MHCAWPQLAAILAVDEGGSNYAIPVAVHSAEGRNRRMAGVFVQAVNSLQVSYTPECVCKKRKAGFDRCRVAYIPTQLCALLWGSVSLCDGHAGRPNWEHACVTTTKIC